MPAAQTLTIEQRNKTMNETKDNWKKLSEVIEALRKANSNE